MSNLITSGIPTDRQYEKLLKSVFFKNVEEYSDLFVDKVGSRINSYNKKWVSDPLHQWSRQWEYPYVINEYKDVVGQNARVLDLGAGMTFLPYYLKELNSKVEVDALDYDISLGELYRSVNKTIGNEVYFKDADIRKLDKKTAKKYDFIYSVSVLEHTNNYIEIIKSCHTLLRKGGKLSLTFDISLDGADDIPIAKARDLLESLEMIFNTEGLVKYLDFEKNEIVRSDKIAKLQPNLMPWRYPFINILRPLLKTGRFGSPYKRLTFCCVTVEKA